MKRFMKYFVIIFCALLLAAHFGRAGLMLFQVISLLIPFLLFWKNKIAARIIQVFLILGGVEWIRIAVHYIRIRMQNGEDWFRLMIILGVVAILTAATSLVFQTNSMKRKYKL